MSIHAPMHLLFDCRTRLYTRWQRAYHAPSWACCSPCCSRYESLLAQIPAQLLQHFFCFTMRKLFFLVEHIFEASQNASWWPAFYDFFSPSGISIDMSCFKEGGLDNATYVANQRSSSEKNRGYFQWKMSPGLAVVPCSVWMVLAVRTVTGSCNLLTRSV